MEDQIKLDHATIERVGPDITQVHFHAETKLTNALVAFVVNACRQIGSRPTKAIVIFPEHMDFNSQIILEDQYVANGITENAHALAIVCHEYGLLPILHLYFAFYPPRFALKFCETEKAAISWLTGYTKEHLAA